MADPVPGVVPGVDAPRSAAPFHRGGRGPAVVLLHGLGMSWRAWRPLLEPLGAEHEVFAPTLPGHRGGPPAPPDISVASLADRLEAMLDEQGLGAAHLVGNSLGGWLAVELARRGRALSVTAVSPAGAYRHPADQLRVHSLLRTSDLVVRSPLTTAALAPALRHPRVRRTVLRQLLERGDRVPAREAVGILRDAHACRVVPALLRAGRRDRMAELAEAAYPIRVVWGRRDRIIPYAGHGRPLLERLPTATRVSLPGAGHVPMYDAPVLLTSLVKELVASGERVGG